MNVHDLTKAVYQAISGKFFHLQPVFIPEHLAYMEAIHKDETYTMTSYAWQNEHIKLARLTLLRSTSRINMLNLAIYPQPTFAASMFVSDLVFINQKLRVAVIDAMPPLIDDKYFEQWVEPFQSIYQQSTNLYPIYERSLDWSYEVLSPFACLATNSDDTRFNTLYTLWEEYFLLYLKLLKESLPSTPAITQQIKDWQTNYNYKHLLVEQQRNPLKHYFGEDLANLYYHQFLFKNQE